MTAQFGKNHLGDADETLPTAHGFDEFFGSLYHLNAEQEFENEDYFKDPEMIKKYKTRGVLHCWANEDGTQKIENTGPLGKKRMETIDDEITEATLDYLEKAKKADKPFFLWWNSTRMHIFTHLKEESKGKTGLGTYPDGMVEHDGHVGQILDKLKELGLDDNTIVMYSTDNGAEIFTLARWRHHAVPRREERKLGRRLSRAVRDPLAGRHQARHRQQRSASRTKTCCPRILAAAGVPDVKEQLLKGMKVGKKTFKVHLDGYNITDRLAGKGENPRKEFFYWNDDGSLVGLRYDNWKIVFQEQRSEGFDVWQDPFTPLRFPKLFNLRSDPFERGRHRSASATPSGESTARSCSCRRRSTSAKYISTFKEFPPSQKVGSFSLDQVLDSLTAAQHQRQVTRRRSLAAQRTRRPAARCGCRPGRGGSGQDFYERYPYPPPIDDLDNYRRRWQDRNRRRADFHLFWPDKPYTEDAHDPRSPAAARRRRPSTPRAVPRPASSASTSARPASGTRRISSASTT